MLYDESAEGSASLPFLMENREQPASTHHCKDRPGDLTPSMAVYFAKLLPRNFGIKIG